MGVNELLETPGIGGMVKYKLGRENKPNSKEKGETVCFIPEKSFLSCLC